MRNRYFLVLGCFLVLVCTTLAQKTFELEDYPVFIGGNELDFPFTGGFNAPQFSEVDLNLDGVKDLVAFDRDGFAFIPFISKGIPNEIAYTYSASFKQHFPALVQFAIFRDADMDGREDLYTYADGLAAGIYIYVSKISGDSVYFEKLEIDQDFPDDVLTFRESNGDLENIYVENIDVPGLADIDFDGDMDVLSFQLGGGKVFYYKNLMVEENRPLNETVFRLEDRCWGGFAEDDNSSNIKLSPIKGDCARAPANSAESRHHSGSTILVIDPDNDSLVDLLLGDFNSPFVAFLENTGMQSVAHMTYLDTTFPIYDTPVEIPAFLGSSKADVNYDGLEDLIFAPNVSDRNSRKSRQISLYKNSGDLVTPYQLESTNFLGNETIDIGAKSAPSIIDLNGDGLLDLLIGKRWDVADPNDINKALVSFLNVGTPSEPKFILDNEDFAGFSEFNEDSRLFVPCWGDLDNDGDQDLLVGDLDGSLIYGENIGGAGNPVIIPSKESNWMNIDVMGQYVAPFLIDLDDDGDLDLLVGERNGNNEAGNACGNINYFENRGSPEIADFNTVPDYQCFGGISTIDSFQIFGYSAPFVYDGTKEKIFITGSYTGSFRQYKLGPPESTFEEINDDVGRIKEGRITTGQMADLDNDGKLELVCGNQRGGIAIYETNFLIDGTTPVEEFQENTLNILAYPNPLIVGNKLTVEIPVWIGKCNLKLFNQVGKLIMTVRSENTFKLETTTLVPGIYFLEVISDRGRQVEKILVAD